MQIADFGWNVCFGSEWRSLKLNGFVQSFPSDRVPAEMPPWCSWEPALHFPFLDFFFIWPCLKNTRCPVLKFDVELTLLSLVFLSSDTSKTHRRLKEAQPCSPQGSNAEPEVCFHTPPAFFCFVQPTGIWVCFTLWCSCERCGCNTGLFIKLTETLLKKRPWPWV